MRSRWGSSGGGRMIVEPSCSTRVAVDGEAGPVVGDLEEHAAGLAEVDRVEVVAVDDARGRHAGLAQVLLPARVLGDRRAPRHVMDRARALAAVLGGRRVVGDRRAADLAAQLPRVLAQRRGAEQLARARCRCAAGARCRRARRRSPAAPASAGISGCSALSGVSPPGRTASSWPRPSGSAKRRRSPTRSWATPSAAKRSRPEGQRLLGADARDDPVHHPGARAARDGAGVLEEGQLGAGAAALVGVEQVVDAGVVLVDGLGHQPQAEHARVEVDVARRVAGDRRDVVDALEPHGSSTSSQIVA